MLDRIAGVIALRSSAYRAVADDEGGTGGAFLIVLVVTLVTGFVNGFVRISQAAQTVTPSLPAGIASAVATAILGIVGWAIGSWILTFVAKVIFQGKTKTVEMLRVTGYVHVFDLVSILSLLAFFSPALFFIAGIIAFVAAILRLIGYIIGVREAAEFSTGKAIITAVIALLFELLIAFLLLSFVLVSVFAFLGVSGTLNP